MLKHYRSRNIVVSIPEVPEVLEVDDVLIVDTIQLENKRWLRGSRGV